MSYIDSHVHLNYLSTKELDDLFLNSSKNKISQFLIPGVLPSELQDSLTIINRYPKRKIYCALGFHPWFLNDISLNTDLSVLQNPKVVAIGETGFDKKADIEVQEIFFRFSIETAIKYKKFIIIHLCHHYEKAFKILSEYKDELPNFILHSWNQHQELTQLFLTNKRAFFSFNLHLLINKKIQQSFLSIPENQILLETDAPDQHIKAASHSRPFDRKNSPLNITDVYKKASELKPSLDWEKLIQFNFEKLINYSSNQSDS